MHNEWFRSLVKTKCDCGVKGTKVFAWGEYVSAKWRTVLHFCEACYPTRVVPQLTAHAGECGCSFQLIGKNVTLPAWLTLNESCKT